MSIGFDRSCDRRKQKSTNIKNIKGKYHVSIHLRDVFGHSQWQEKAFVGLGCKLPLTRNTDNAVLNKDNAVNNAKIKLTLSHGIYRIIHQLFNNNLYYLSKLQVRHLQSFNM